MFQLYPEIKPFARHTLKVDDLHELYLDESGNQHGIPILFVHSGPGSGCEFNSRCFFDPEKYRIILFDQRGSGRSTPHSETNQNTLDDLIADMEKIREYLGVAKWALFGGGWGSTLSLAYAQTHPEFVMGLILRGTFLGRKADVDWLYQDGASHVFPDYWEDFKLAVAGSAQQDLVASYHQRLNGLDELAIMGAAKAWSMWESHCASLHPNQRLIKHYANSHRSLARAKLSTHYFTHDCFLDDNQILNNMHKIADIPGILVHGRFDMVSRLENAYSLNKVWPASQLFVIREAGHSATEPAIIDALIRATRDLAHRFEA
jgi:proline iminopeptidase